MVWREKVSTSSFFFFFFKQILDLFTSYETSGKSSEPDEPVSNV